MPNVGIVCFLASYSLAMFAELSRLKWRSRVSHWLMLGLTSAGLAAHTIYLLVRAQTTDLPPLLSSAHDWLLVLAWLTVTVYLVVTLLESDLAAGIIVLPLVVALVVASLFVTRSSAMQISPDQGWTMLHVSLLVFGIGGILVGLVAGLMYLWQHYRLKHRQTLQPGLTLPNLERLEKLNRLAILVSVPLLTFGMALGFGLIVMSPDNTEAGGRLMRDPLVIGSAIGWILMAGIFAWLARSRVEPGRQVARLTVWSCGFLLLTVIGGQVLSNFAPGKTLHGNPRQEIRS
jgi:ABC-type transport system involved in cytochrome c biogenesis permease subunit